MTTPTLERRRNYAPYAAFAFDDDNMPPSSSRNFSTICPSQMTCITLSVSKPAHEELDQEPAVDVRVVVENPKPISTVEVREVGPDDPAYYEK